MTWTPTNEVARCPNDANHAFVFHAPNAGAHRGLVDVEFVCDTPVRGARVALESVKNRAVQRSDVVYRWSGGQPVGGGLERCPVHVEPGYFDSQVTLHGGHAIKSGKLAPDDVAELAERAGQHDHHHVTRPGRHRDGDRRPQGCQFLRHHPRRPAVYGDAGKPKNGISKGVEIGYCDDTHRPFLFEASQPRRDRRLADIECFG